MTFNFAIPKLTPTNNVLLRMHWRERRALNTEWFWLVKVATQDLEIPRPAPNERRRLAIMSWRVQLADDDNLRGGMKPLLDALKNAELIYDDGPRYIDSAVFQGQVGRREEEQTTIRLKLFRAGPIPKGGPR